MSDSTFNFEIASPIDIAALVACWAAKRARTYPVQVAYVHTSHRGELNGMPVPLTLGFASIAAANAWIRDARKNAEISDIRLA